MSDVVVVGANGQLGSDLCRTFPLAGHRLVALTRSDLELRDHDGVARVLEAIRPSVVVNTAAFHKVEACESDVEQAFAVNSVAVRNLALVTDQIDARLVHLSTDYVFDGDSATPYGEDAVPNPINVYGTSKVAGEYFVKSLCRRHLIVRTSGLFGLAGSSGKGGNFIQTMLRLGRERGWASVVNDQVLSPTYTTDLAETIWRLVESEAQGLFHVTNSGSCSWYELACAVFEQSGVPAQVRPATSDRMSGSVRRPRYSVLENGRLMMEIGMLRSWREALQEYLEVSGAAVDFAAAPVQAGGNRGTN